MTVGSYRINLVPASGVRLEGDASVVSRVRRVGRRGREERRGDDPKNGECGESPFHLPLQYSCEFAFPAAMSDDRQAARDECWAADEPDDGIAAQNSHFPLLLSKFTTLMFRLKF